MEFLEKYKKLIVITVSVICIVTMIITAAYKIRPTLVENVFGFIITPGQKGVTHVSSWFVDKLGFFKNIDTVKQENEVLKLQVENLKSENDRLKLVEQENKKLTDLLKVDQKYAEFPKIGAETIAKDPSNWFDKFTIDRGTKDGLADDMVVLSSGGLVGKILDARANYSQVISLINDTSSISAKCLRTEDLGIVKGDMGLMKEGLCRMDYLDVDAEILEGDEIVTSQVSGIYPPGIIIGIVKEVKTDAKHLTKTAIIQPVVDFKHIDTVLVINKTFKRVYDSQAEEQQ